MSFEELLHYLRLGGLTMAVILAASVLALGVAIERGDFAAARSAAERSGAIAADIYLAGFDRLAKGGDAIGSLEAAVERERAQVGLRLRRYLWILGTIGATTPFIGLFGTVAGIMRAFRDLGLDVESGGTGNTAAVMGGISEALITTAGGILVAVEAVVLYNYFQTRLARIALELRLLTEEFVELLRERRASATAVAVETKAPAPALFEATLKGT